MKKKNACLEFADQRSESLIRNFRESIARQSQISAMRAFEDAANAPAPRFWVSESRAARIVSMMLKGEDPTEGMHVEKRKMYVEICRRVKEEMAKLPSRPLGDIVFDVVNSPAPSSYMTISNARHIIYSRRRSITK